MSGCVRSCVCRVSVCVVCVWSVVLSAGLVWMFGSFSRPLILWCRRIWNFACVSLHWFAMSICFLYA